MEPGYASHFVPAAPVWQLVRRRQRRWSYTDDEMAAWLGLARVMDARAWMLRTTAERILRRLAFCPAPATAGTNWVLDNMLRAEASPKPPTPGSEEASRIHAELRGEELDEPEPAPIRAAS